MCMAIPSRILVVDGHGMAEVECFGVTRRVSLMLLSEPVEIGDYVIVSAGQFAIEKVERQAALEALDHLAEVLGEEGLLPGSAVDQP